MQKTVSIISLIGAALIILDSVSATHWVLLFFLAGVIPGTNLLIDPVDMMAAVATAITIVILRVTMWQSVRPLFFTPTSSHRSTSPAANRSVHYIV